MMMNIELFRHHNNHEDEARIILTGSSGSVLPPVALWVAQSYRLTPGQGGLHCSRGGVLNIKVHPVFHQGGRCGVHAVDLRSEVCSRPGGLHSFVLWTSSHQ